MEIRTIDGRRATDRRGAAEHLGRSLDTIKHLAADRATTGFPQPADVETEGRGVRNRDNGTGGREWYALDDLDTFKATYSAAATITGTARRVATLPGDPDELLAGDQIAKELGIKADTWRSWVRDSKANWEAGLAAYLPAPDEEEPGRGGLNRKWSRATINAWLPNRTGPNPAPGRPTGRTLTIADVDVVLEANRELTNAQIAATLTTRLGRTVSAQAVSRIRRLQREAATTP